MRSEEMKRKRILDSAIRLFMAHGYARISMEEIARSAGVGKGTIYQLFESKQALMFAGVDLVVQQLEKEFEGLLRDTATTPPQKLNLFLHALSARISGIHPEALRQLQHDLPEAYEKIQSARERIIFHNLKELLRSGKEFGVYRSDIDEALVADIVIGAADYVTQGRVYATLNYAPQQLFETLLSIILKGCYAEEYRNKLNIF
ncbi:TetR/AcrR family transcriptional regulator [Acetanaerobacterium elongatum]|uniref:Transcriptional regulator, TetR family n=1 Tax=Acetanaerobacterium elongatum TaxID=258515 RepID=A0A1H0C634_9FIRM|nr:TetR/AcrR family transcriptional regulator [Acetanaerobacterium elongatum]SDN53344.1 transcriptional regulator, TetR family [Acetanaerobacterium elongatum]